MSLFESNRNLARVVQSVVIAVLLLLLQACGAGSGSPIPMEAPAAAELAVDAEGAAESSPVGTEETTPAGADSGSNQSGTAGSDTTGSGTTGSGLTDASDVGASDGGSEIGATSDKRIYAYTVQRNLTTENTVRVLLGVEITEEGGATASPTTAFTVKISGDATFASEEPIEAYRVHSSRSNFEFVGPVYDLNQRIYEIPVGNPNCTFSGDDGKSLYCYTSMERSCKTDVGRTELYEYDCVEKPLHLRYFKLDGAYNSVDSVEIAIVDTEPGQSKPVATTDIAFVEPEVNDAIRSVGNVGAIRDLEQFVTADIEIPYVASNVGSAAEALFSENITPTSAKITKKYYRGHSLENGEDAALEIVEVSDCPIIDKEVKCAFDNSHSGEWMIAELELGYVLSGEQDGNIDWRISSSAYEASPQNNQFFTTVYNYLPMSVLQTMINAALPGDSVQFPVGQFSGQLDLLNKSLNIEGANSPEKTVLVSDKQSDSVLVNFGDHSVLSHLHIFSHNRAIDLGTSTGVTIANSVFEPSVVLEGIGSWMINGRESRGYRLVGNRFSNFTRCAAVANVSIYGDSWIEHNVFANNRCSGFSAGQLYMANGQPDRYVNIQNNTFYNNSTGIYIDFYGRALGTTRYDVRLFNNLFEANRNSLVLKQAENYSSHRIWNSASRIRTSKNMTDEAAAFGDPVSASYSAIYTVIEPDYTDSSAGLSDGNYTPAVGTLAVDGAGQVLRYAATPDPAEAIPFSVLPVDGNGDGSAVLDIGAVEYIP